MLLVLAPPENDKLNPHRTAIFVSTVSIVGREGSFLTDTSFALARLLSLNRLPGTELPG